MDTVYSLACSLALVVFSFCEIWSRLSFHDGAGQCRSIKNKALSDFFCACVRLRAGLVLFSVSPTFKGLCLRRAARVKALMKCNMYVRLCCSGRKRDSVICDSLKHISCFYSWSSPCRKQSSVSMPWRSSVLLKTTTANCVCCSRCLASRTMQSSRQENDNFAS